MAGTASGGNVILLPKTIDYYQIQLTRMLETERYAEALQLLRFLLDCRADDERLKDEWQALSDWLATMAPVPDAGAAEPAPEEEEGPDSESELLKEHVRRKSASDTRYTAHLLQLLTESRSTEKQMLALEQLAYAEGSEIDETVAGWLRRAEQHPLVQFKALQVLRLRGAQGAIRLPRPDGALRVDIERTPLSFADFPEQFRSILLLIGKVSEVHDPALHYYAEQTWNEFLAFVYGTEVYRHIERSGPEEFSRWAAALHTVLLEALHHQADEPGTRRLYGLDDGPDAAWEIALRFMRRFASAVFLRG